MIPNPNVNLIEFILSQPLTMPIFNFIYHDVNSWSEFHWFLFATNHGLRWFAVLDHLLELIFLRNRLWTFFSFSSSSFRQSICLAIVSIYPFLSIHGAMWWIYGRLFKQSFTACYYVNIVLLYLHKDGVVQTFLVRSDVTKNKYFFVGQFTTREILRSFA